jgi:hypothetical protein
MQLLPVIKMLCSFVIQIAQMVLHDTGLYRVLVGEKHVNKSRYCIISASSDESNNSSLFHNSIVIQND